MTDLKEARQSFLLFSSNAVEFVLALRQQHESFRALRVYHCPMAPRPGNWLQLKAPLRNPFYGAKMLECGEEVEP